jgi:hypothetical protein
MHMLSAVKAANAWMWVYVGDDAHPHNVFHFTPDRGHPSQTRTCKSPASGSPWESFAPTYVTVDQCRAHTLARQPISLVHPFQIDTWLNEYRATLGLLFASSAICLPFRVQVCKVQCPLPCFPSTALFYGISLLSTGPIDQVSQCSPILQRRYAILHCMPVTYDFAPGFRASLPCFVPRFRAPVRPETVFPDQGHPMPASIPCLRHAPRPRPNPDILAH